MTRPPQNATPLFEEKLAEIEAELRLVPRGASRAVGGGVQMRLNADGSRSFQIRPRSGGKQKGRTFASWQEAPDSLHQAAPPVAPPTASEVTPLSVFDMTPGPKAVIGPTHAELRNMRFRDYRKNVYWPWATTHLSPVTQRDYRRLLRNDAEPIIGDYTLAQIADSPAVNDQPGSSVRQMTGLLEECERMLLHVAAPTP